MVFGLHETCDGVRFGRLKFLKVDPHKFDYARINHPEFPKGAQMLARVSVDAVAEVSATERAEEVIDEHLMILNALCTVGVPSLIQVSRTDHVRASFSGKRIGKTVSGMAKLECYGHNRRMPLMGAELRARLKNVVGARVSVRLRAKKCEFSDRILISFQFAGSACVDTHPERSFLMFAIALESLILGSNTHTELTDRLATRTAHLIGTGAEGRKIVLKTTKDLYARRSKIVHAGEYGVPQSQRDYIFMYCMAALSMLAAVPVFRKFKTNAELEAWFAERTLEGPFKSRIKS